MSKAEKRACQYTGYCRNQSYSDFLNGYHKAEKDVALTWEDLATIEKLGDDFVKHNQTPMSDEEFYIEVLNQFNKLKGR